VDIDLGGEIVFNVKLGDKSYQLREPTLKDVKSFKISTDGENAEDAFIDLVVGLGMPREVAEGLGITKLKKLSESLITGFDEKK